MAEQNYTAYVVSTTNGTVTGTPASMHGFSIVNAGGATTVKWSDNGVVVWAHTVPAATSVVVVPGDVGVRFNTNVTVDIGGATSVSTFFIIVK